MESSSSSNLGLNIILDEQCTCNKMSTTLSCIVNLGIAFWPFFTFYNNYPFFSTFFRFLCFIGGESVKTYFWVIFISSILTSYCTATVRHCVLFFSHADSPRNLCLYFLPRNSACVLKCKETLPEQPVYSFLCLISWMAQSALLASPPPLCFWNG